MKQSPEKNNSKPLPRMMKGMIGLLLILPISASGDVVIKLVGGKRIVVPVEKSEVESIEFIESGVSGPKAPALEPERISQGATTNAYAAAQIWQVGPEHVLKLPSDAAKRAKDGDIVEISAGTYHNDYAKWRQNDITIRGIGGMAHLKSDGLIPNRKGIWILKGNNIVIENIEFSGAVVKDGNGTGIRHEGGDLTLRNTFFHHNEFSILTGKRPGASIEIISSRFWFQQRNNRFSHGIYIGNVRRFTLMGSHFKGTDQGHQVKSRALENHILYNRIEDVPGGNSSRLIDLPNCGLSFVIGNDLHQAAKSQNFTAIGYGHEGCESRTQAQKILYAVNNTFINEAKSSTFVDNQAGGAATVANNLFFGRVNALKGQGQENHNVQEKLAKRRQHSWDSPSDSAAINGAIHLDDAGGVPLTPGFEFAPPSGTRERLIQGALDVGSREINP